MSCGLQWTSAQALIADPPAISPAFIPAQNRLGAARAAAGLGQSRRLLAGRESSPGLQDCVHDEGIALTLAPSPQGTGGR